MVFHVLNRGNDRRTIFENRGDYRAFLRLIGEIQQVVSMRLLAYCLMPNHWHLLLWPERDGDLGTFMHRLTITHVRRWQLRHQTVGYGHLYQGPYKSFPVQDDSHFYAACRYVERNALRANLVLRAQDWQWGSLARSMGEQSVQQTAQLFQLASVSATELVRVGERGTERGRVERSTHLRSAGASFRHQVLATRNSQTIGIGVHAARKRPAPETRTVTREKRG